jgi:hypothetical protein
LPEAGDKAHQMRYGSMMSVGSLFPLFMNSVVRRALWATGLLAASWSTAWAGAQIEEPLADSVRSALSAAVGRGEPPKLVFADEAQRQQCARWTQAQEARLRKRKPEELVRHEFLNTVCYEAKRAGLIQSGFRKHAMHAGARGYMSWALIRHPGPDPAPLPRGKGQPLHGAGALQRQRQYRTVTGRESAQSGCTRLQIGQRAEDQLHTALSQLLSASPVNRGRCARRCAEGSAESSASHTSGESIVASSKTCCWPVR